MASNTYVAVGNKEDMSDIITNIAPFDTPLFNLLGRTKGTEINHEWLEDSLGDPDDNAYPEGFTFFTNDAVPRVRLGNYMQIMERGVHVTGSQQAVLHYGVADEMAYQMQKTLKELAFDCEQALLTQPAKIIGSMTVPRRFGGLPYWIITHVFGNGGVLRPLTFDMLNTALEQTWRDGGHPSILMVSPRNKRVISTFTAGNIKHMEGSAKKISQIIDVIETDFGMLQIRTNRFMPDDKIYGLSPEYMKKAFLRPFKQKDLPEINDMIRKVVYGEWTLEMRAEKAHFVITDLDGIVPATP
jgi:hypothetical protein